MANVQEGFRCTVRCHVWGSKPSKSLYFRYRQTCNGFNIRAFVLFNPLGMPQSVSVSLKGHQASIFGQIGAFGSLSSEQICRVTRFTRVLLSFTPFFIVNGVYLSLLLVVFP
jgi:hypothetical protein